jgi:hypothetical protein
MIIVDRESFSEQAGAVAATSLGTTVASGGSAGTYGSWVEFFASTSYDAKGVHITNVPSNGQFYSVQLGVGAASSEVVVAEFGAGKSCGMATTLPVQIKAGSRVALRCTSAGGANNTLFTMRLGRGGGNCLLAGGHEYGGVTTGAWTTIDPGGTANTKGAYAQLIASTARPAKGFTLWLGTQNDGTTNNQLLDIAIGAASSEQIILADACIRSPSYAAMQISQIGPIWTPIPEGSRIAVRSQSSTNLTTSNSRYLYGAITLWR